LSNRELILSVENLAVGYDVELISKINLEIRAGEIIAIVGPSGIGKTTFLRTVAGLVRPLGGEISCNAQRRGGIGYIPQRLGLVRHTSVYHNVDLGARSGTPFWSEPLTWFKRRHTRVLDAVNRMGLVEKIDEPVRRLSGGQQRRVATARTLAQRPKLILADEFLSELDDDNISIVLDAVKEYMKESESAMIIVEHNIQRAAEISDKLLQMNLDGKLVDYELEPLSEE
tara:strand:+ start:5188 stop:5871 length:684 start_codon:yes stop_codon:yes gene_type:complete